MLNTTKRGLLASVGALATSLALVLSGAAAAQATGASTPPRTSGLVITKLEQPAKNGEAATGLPQPGAGKGIEGVSFEAYKVPLTKDPLTREGQAEVAATTLQAAQGKINAAKADRTGTTNASGEIRWDQKASQNQLQDRLAAGLWLIRETQTPANVVASGDFLVATPLTNPTDGKSWLDTIHVYPKNQVIQGTKTVKNVALLTTGLPMTWTISVNNPSPRDPVTGQSVAAEMLQVVDVLDDSFLLTPVDGSGMNVTSPEGLTRTTDYTVNVASAGGKSTVTVDFTAAGLAKLAANSAKPVTLTLNTRVQQSGTITNTATFKTSSKQKQPLTTSAATVKYGDYALVKKSSEGNAPLAGAEFKVFTDEATARAAADGDAAARGQSLSPQMPTTGYDVVNKTWVTDAQGRVNITGLRYSGYADGAAIAPGSPGYQYYWLVETKAPKGYQLLAEPVRIVIDDASKTQKEEIVNQQVRNGFVLPLTGGTGTLALTLGGIALLALVLIVSRRRRGDAAAAE